MLRTMRRVAALILTLIFFMGATSGSAASADTKGLWIDGAVVTKGSTDVKYDPDTHKLTLTNYTKDIEEGYLSDSSKTATAIYCNDDKGLSIDLIGTNKITLKSRSGEKATSGITKARVIAVSKNLEITGSGTLTIIGSGDIEKSYGILSGTGSVTIKATGKIDVESGKATKTSVGISAATDVSIDVGEIVARGGVIDTTKKSEKATTGVTAAADESGSFGIKGANVKIGPGVNTITASGDTAAISGNVTLGDNVKGTAWDKNTTDNDKTGGTAITYGSGVTGKEVFIYKAHKVTFNANGGTFPSSTGTGTTTTTKDIYTSGDVAVSPPSPAPNPPASMSGYTVGAWTRKDNGSVWNFANIVSGDLELNARWDNPASPAKSANTSSDIITMSAAQKAATTNLELGDLSILSLSDVKRVLNEMANLTEISVSQNADVISVDWAALPANKVKTFKFSGNTRVTNLDLTKNSTVPYIEAKNCTALESVDLRNNSNVLSLDISGSSVSTLNARGSKVRYLNCSRSDLSNFNTFNITDCSELVSLNISGSHFLGLDIDVNTMGLKKLNDLQCGGQELDHWEASTTLNFNRFMNDPDIVETSSNAEVADVYKVTNFKAYDDDGSEIVARRSGSTYLFEKIPYKIAYSYNTGFKNTLMDVTVFADETIDRDPEPEDETGKGGQPTVIQPNPPTPRSSTVTSSSGGGCNTSSLIGSGIVLALSTLLARKTKKEK